MFRYRMGIINSNRLEGNKISEPVPLGILLTIRVPHSTRIFFSFVRSLKLGFGLSLGARFFKFVTGIPGRALVCDVVPVVPWYAYLLIVPFSAATCITLKAHWHQWPMASRVSDNVRVPKMHPCDRCVL
jgi:hypothetical protein